MDTAYRHLETLLEEDRHDNGQWKYELPHGRQVLEGYNLAENSASQMWKQLRLSPNHRTLWLHTHGDDLVKYIYLRGRDTVDLSFLN